jgi:hypothetical protein
MKETVLTREVKTISGMGAKIQDPSEIAGRKNPRKGD